MDHPTVPFLDLPAHHNIQVYDILHFTSSGSSPSDYTLKDFTTGAGTLLVSKIIDALRRWPSNEAYSDEDITKVGGLVERNLYTVQSAQVREEVEKSIHPIDGEAERDANDIDIPRLTVEMMLNGLFDKSITRDGVVNINSNEPVLLINFDGGRMNAARRDQCDYVMNIVGREVQQKWNIWPVRVYGGAFLGPSSLVEQEEGGKDGSPGFSITLLNVVNTDIGGPSMPQLLDAELDAPEWNAFMMKEVWRGREMVSREYGPGSIAALADDASERSLRSVDDESVGSEVHIHHEPADRPSGWEERSLAGSEEGHQEVSTVDDTQKADTQLPAQHGDHRADDIDSGDQDSHGQDQAEAATQDELVPEELSLPARQIEHPTWDRHGDSMSLLDLIKSQVSMIAPFGTETVGHGVRDMEAAGAEAAEARPEPLETSGKAKASSEDDFVVV